MGQGDGEGGHLGGERPMGAAAGGGRGLKGRTRGSGQRPIGAARYRQQSIRAPCPPPPRPPPTPLTRSPAGQAGPPVDVPHRPGL